MNHQPPGHDTYGQRYQGHLLCNNNSKEPLDVQNRCTKWNRCDYNHVNQFQRIDSRQTGNFRQQTNTDYRSQRWNDFDRDGKSFSHRSEFELNESRSYNKYKPYRGRGHYQGEDRDQRDRSRAHNWKKRGRSFNKMQAKRPSDIEIERHDKKRRLMEGCSFQDGRNRNIEEKLPSNEDVISEICNFLERRDKSYEGKQRSSSRETFADSRRSSSREGSQNRSSKDRKIVKSIKSDSDKSHSSHSSKDFRKRHNSSTHSLTERQEIEKDTSKSTAKIVNTKPDSTNEMPKQKLEEEKTKEKALCENVTIPANSTLCTSVLKSVSVDKVSVSNTKSHSKGSQDKCNIKSTSKHSNTVHIKPKVSLKTVDNERSSVSPVNKLTDTAVKSLSSSSASSLNPGPSKVLPKIPKVKSNSGVSTGVTTNETKKLAKKHQRHSLGNVPLQPSSKPSVSSGSSADGKQLIKKKHRHSSGHISQSSPKKNIVVTSETVSEVTQMKKDHDASADFLLSERDESLPHLVHRKRHSRISDSNSPPQNNITEKTVGASGLFHVDEKGIRGKDDVKKASKTTDEESHRHSKTSHGKENIVTTNVSKNLSKSVTKDHDKHRSKVKSLKKKTVSNSKEKTKHSTSVKPAGKEKVLDAVKKSSSFEKHCKSGEAQEGKKAKLIGSLEKEGTGNEVTLDKSHHKNPGDLNMDPFVSVKKLPNKTLLKVPSDVNKDKAKTVENIPPIKSAEVQSSAPVTQCAERDAVSNRERMSLFDLFKDSSKEHTPRKPSKLSLKRTPDKLRKEKPTSSIKSNTEQTKLHHNKRKIEEKLNENIGKKAKLPHIEEVSSSKLKDGCSEALTNICESNTGSDKPNSICDTTNSEAEKSEQVVSISASNHSTLETDISSSGVSEKDVHNESSLSVNSSGRLMDESGSGCTSFSLSSCMSSPSFSKSDTMLSDHCSEMETTCDPPELESGHFNGDIEQSMKSKNSKCDSSKGMSLYDSDEDDDDGGRLVIDFNPCSVTTLVDTETEKNLKPKGETLKVEGGIRVTGELETSECFQPVEEMEIPLEVREFCLDRTNQMDETIPYSLDDTPNSSVDQQQTTSLSQSETFTLDLPPQKINGNTPMIEKAVPDNSVLSEDSSVDLLQRDSLHQSRDSSVDLLQRDSLHQSVTTPQDEPFVSSGNATEIKEKTGCKDVKKEGFEVKKQTDTITQSDTTPHLPQVSVEQTTDMDVTVPSRLVTTEEHSVNQSQSDTLPRSDTTPQDQPVNYDPEAIDTNESQQMNNDKPTFKFPRINEHKPKQKHSGENKTSTDDLVSSQDETMDVSLSDFDDKDDIREIMYNGGDIESPWTPMPATPYISYSQEDDTQEDESLPEEDRVCSPVSEGWDITPDQEKALNSDLEKDTSHNQERDNSLNIEQQEQKPNIHAAFSDGSSSDSNSHIQKETSVHNPSLSNEPKTQLSEKNSSLEIPELPVTIIKIEPVEGSCVMDATKKVPKSQTERIRQAGMTRSSSVDQLMAQKPELSKPSFVRSQSVGGESNTSLSASHGRPSISEDLSPSDVALTTTATTTLASESATITTNVDSISAAEINSMLNLGTLTTEQHDFLAQLTKGLDQLTKLGCGSMKVPLKHDKISTDNNRYTSFGYFSLKHLTVKNMIRCIECKECSDLLSPREFIVHLCVSMRHVQFEIDRLLRTTIEFCTSHADSSIGERCARALFIIIFKLERSIYRSCLQSSLCQTVSSPTGETNIAVSPQAATQPTKSLSGPVTPSSPLTLEKEQPSFDGASALPNFVTTDPPSTTTTQSTPSALSTPQRNNLPTMHTIEETLSTSLALGEILSNIPGVGGSQTRKGINGAVETTTRSQGTGQHSLTTQVGEQPLQQNGAKQQSLTTQVGGQPLQHNGAKQHSLTAQVGGQPFQHDGAISVAPSSVSIGQPTTAPINSFRSAEMEKMLQCMQQSSSQKRNSRQSLTNADNLLPGSTPPRARRLSKNGMEGQRSQYNQSRVENPEIFGQISLPDSRMYNPSADQTYQGPGARNRRRRGHQLEALLLPETSVPVQTWPGNNVMMPSTCSRTSFNQGGQLSSMSSAHSRTIENVNPGNLHASNPFQTGSYSAGQIPNHSSGQYPANFTNARFTTGEPQGISKHAGYTRPQLSNGPNACAIPYGSSGNIGSFNRMGAQTSMAFQSSVNNLGPQGNLGPQCNNTAALPNTYHHTGTTGQFRNAVGPHGITGPQNTLLANMLGNQCSNITGPQSTSDPNGALQQNVLGQQQSNTIGPQSTLDPHCTSSTAQRTSGFNSASGPQQPSCAAQSKPSAAQSDEAVNSSESHDRFSPSMQEKFWASLSDRIQSEEDAYQIFIMGQLMQRKGVEWLRDTLKDTRAAMEKMDKEHKEEMRKRKESEEQVNNRFNGLISIVENYTKKPS